jgi:hypothetical protein
MTLAAVLFLGVSWAAADPTVVAATVSQAPTQAASTNASSNTSSQNQNPSSNQSSSNQSSGSQSPSPQHSPASSNGQTSAGQTSAPAPASAHPVHKKKKPVSSDCANAPPASSAAASSGTTAKASGADTGTQPANCPPKKTIVPEGSTGEAHIELAGGQSGDQTAQRDTANQMLGTAEGNLKKMDGRQLTESQKDLITQIRQFMDQSRSAVKAGELDRARTLAWKAQTLSEELIKPDNQ